MATCPYGASVKPGVDPTATVIVDRATWAQMTGAATTWFDPWLAFLQPKPLLVSDLVAANPDDPPLPSPLVLIEALRPDTFAIAAPQILDYMWRKLTYYTFTQVAVCNAAPPTTGTCTVGQTFHYGSGSWNPDNAPATWLGTIGPNHKRFTLDLTGVSNPSFPSAYYLSITLDNGAGGSLTQLPSWTFYPLSTTHLDTGVLSSGHPFTRVGFTISSGAAGRVISITGATITATECYTTGGGSSTPPPTSSTPTQPTQIVIPPVLSCGTTADLCTAVRQLDQRLTQIYQMVTIIQRHAVPFAYVPGAVHSGLTGTGSFPISQLMGLRIQLAAVHGDVVLPGNPPYLWDQGWLSINDSQGMIEEKRLTRTGFEWLPTSCRMATSFNWDLADGVIMHVTELEAET